MALEVGSYQPNTLQHCEFNMSRQVVYEKRRDTVFVFIDDLMCIEYILSKRLGHWNLQACASYTRHVRGWLELHYLVLRIKVGAQQNTRLTSEPPHYMVTDPRPLLESTFYFVVFSPARQAR